MQQALRRSRTARQRTATQPYTLLIAAALGPACWRVPAPRWAARTPHREQRSFTKPGGHSARLEGALHTRGGQAAGSTGQLKQIVDGHSHDAPPEELQHTARAYHAGQQVSTRP